MKSTTKLVITILFLSFLTISCNLPFLSNFINQPSQTPNATLTALFNMSEIIPATITPNIESTSQTQEPVYVVITATPDANMIPSDQSASPSAATLTAGPTNTAQPTTAVVLQRYNPQVTAKYLKSAPIQDGTYAEWIDYTTKFTVTNKVWGASNWSSHDDLDAAYAFGWDESNLYFSIKVTDEKYTQKYSGVDIYHGDEVELLLDVNLLNDFYSTTLDGDDFQIGFSAGNPSQEIPKTVYLWYPKNIQGARTDIAMSYQFEDKPIYRIETAIPWKMLGVTPYAGMRIGFAVNVNDNDDVATYKEQTMLSTGAGLSVFNPTTWGELVLLK